MMITFIRTLSFTPDKMEQVMSFTLQLKRFLKVRYGLETKARMPIGGSPNRIPYVAKFENLGELEILIRKVTADPEYRRMLAGNARNIVAGSIHDEIWRDVDVARESAAS